MADHAAESLDGVRRADLLNAVVTGETQLGFVGQRGHDGFSRRRVELHQHCKGADEKQRNSGESNTTIHAKVEFGIRIVELSSELDKREYEKTGEDDDSDDLRNTPRSIEPLGHSVGAAIDQIGNGDQQSE